MKTEIEAKFLNQNHDSIRQRLRQAGAVCEYPMKLMRRTVFDYPSRSLQKQGAWVRLREELDGSIEMTLKQVKKDTLTGTREATVTVGDYEAAIPFLTALGLEVKGEQESKREVWQLGDVEIMLDEWPWVRPFIEIEAPTEASVKEVASKLGLHWSEAKFGGVTPVYVAEYIITKDEFEALDLSMKFGDPIPDALVKR
jgi:adenylate cyclase class 2